jgi:hypothetical protein
MDTQDQTDAANLRVTFFGYIVLAFLITVAIGLGAEFVYLVFVDPFGVIFWLVVLFVFVVLPFGIIAAIVEKIRQ